MTDSELVNIIILHIFQFSGLGIKELYIEGNPLLQHVPVHSVQEEEVLSLKVCCSSVLCMLMLAGMFRAVNVMLCFM